MRKFRRILALCVGVTAIILMLVACDSDLDVKQVYSFGLQTMPVQKRIIEGETAEIRCALLREGNYDETRYWIRYFQTDGKGELRLYTPDGMLFSPNDLYPLEMQVFRLFYTSACTDQQNIDIYVEDNYGQVASISFSFQNEKGDEAGETDSE
ncbi:DUF3872 domain-containing protein [Parabacteroides sp. OttesenSCG-928-G06]|nr:DUF3872 domain-containing protein [Parabacteroides sp. OttesenSCG-928-G06]